jgi:hypothetical protein
VRLCVARFVGAGGGIDVVEMLGELVDGRARQVDAGAMRMLANEAVPIVLHASGPMPA